jgi:hypothetical protein
MNETLGEAAWRLAFGGLSPEQVFALREGSAWRLLPGGAADRYAGLLSIADLDAFLRTDAARHPRVTMAMVGGRAARPFHLMNICKPKVAALIYPACSPGMMQGAAWLFRNSTNCMRRLRNYAGVWKRFSCIRCRPTST